MTLNDRCALISTLLLTYLLTYLLPQTFEGPCVHSIILGARGEFSYPPPLLTACVSSKSGLDRSLTKNALARKNKMAPLNEHVFWE